MTERGAAALVRDDEGFTLVESVIAILVLSIAVVTIVGSLVAMIDFTSQHRGHAVTETAARTYGQAVQAQAQTAVPLGSLSGTSLTLNGPNTLPTGGTGSYVYVEREVMGVVSNSGSSLTVTRQLGGIPVSSAPSGATVTPLLVCPSASLLTPRVPPELGDNVTASIIGVEYWNSATQSFGSDQAACQALFTETCTTEDFFEILPECSAGLFRVRIEAATVDERLKSLTTQTSVLVRSAGGLT